MSCKYQSLRTRKKYLCFTNILEINKGGKKAKHFFYLRYTGRRSDFDSACPKMAVKH